MVLRVRALSDDERRAVKRLAHSRTAAARQVERARIVLLSSEGKHAPVIARDVGVCEPTVRLWLKRFTALGVAGLADRHRSGMPPTYTPEQVRVLIATVLARPQALGLPFATWTLDRLAAYLHEQHGIAMKRSRVDEILLAEAAAGALKRNGASGWPSPLTKSR